MAIHDLDDRPAAAQNNAAIESDMEISDNSDAELEQQVSLLAQQSSASAPPPPKPSAPTPTQVPTQAQAQAPSSFNIVKDEIPVDDWVMGRKPLFSRPPKSLIINVANDNPADNKIIEDIYGPFPEVSFPTYQSGAMKDTEEMARALLELKQRIARAEELRRQSASPVTPVATLATTPPAKSTPVESSSLASPALKKPITADSSSSKPIVKPITPPNTSSNLVVQTSPDTSAPTAKISLPTKPARPQEPLKEVTKELPKQPEKMIVDPVTEPVKASSTDVPMKERMNEPVKTAIDVPVKESVNEPVKTSIDVPMKEAIVEAVKEPIKESTKQVTELGTQSLPTKPITPSAKSVNLSTKPSTTEPSTSTRRPSIKEATLNALQNLIEINESKLKASSLISASRAPVPFTSFSASALIAPPPREPESLAKVPTSPLVKPSVSAPLSELPPAEPHVQNTDDMNVEESDDSNEYYGTPPSSPIREEPTEEEIVADIKRMIASIDQQKKAIEEAEERKKEINLKILKAEVLLSIERNRQKSRAMEDPVVGKKRPLDPETSLEQQIKRLKEDDELSDMDIADDVSVGSSSSPSAPNYGVPASSSAPTSTATTTSAPPRSAPISSSSIPASSIARPHVSASIPPIPFNQALSSHSSASPHTIPLPSIPSSNLPPMHHGRGTIPTAGNSSFPSGLSHSSTSSSTYPVPQMPLATLSMPPPVQPTVSKPTVSQPTAVKSTVKSTASAKPSAAESITGKRQSPMVKPKSARVVPLADGLQLTTYMTELEALVKFRLSEQKPTTDNQNVVRPPPRPARLVIVDGFTLTMDSVLLNRDHGKPKEMPNTPGAGSTDPTSAITSTDDEKPLSDSAMTNESVLLYLLQRDKPLLPIRSLEVRSAVSRILDALPPRAVQIISQRELWSTVDFTEARNLALSSAMSFGHVELLWIIYVELSLYVNNDESDLALSIKRALVHVPLSVDVRWQATRTTTGETNRLREAISILRAIESIRNTEESPEPAVISNLTTEVLLRVLKYEGMNAITHFLMKSPTAFSTEKIEPFSLEETPIHLMLVDHDIYLLWTTILYHFICGQMPDTVYRTWFSGLIANGDSSEPRHLYTVDWSSVVASGPLTRAETIGSVNILLSMLRYFSGKTQGNKAKRPILMGAWRTLLDLLAHTDSYRKLGTVILLRDGLSIDALRPEIDVIAADLCTSIGDPAMARTRLDEAMKTARLPSQLMLAFRLASSLHPTPQSSLETLSEAAQLIASPLKPFFRPLPAAQGAAEPKYAIEYARHMYLTALDLDQSLPMRTNHSFNPALFEHCAFAWINMLYLTEIGRWCCRGTPTYDMVTKQMKSITKLAVDAMESEDAKRLVFKFSSSCGI